MKLRIAVVGVLVVVGAAGMALAQATPSIQGVWRVTEEVVTGADAGTNKNPQPTLYIFTKQHYSILEVNSTTPRKDFGNAANEAKLTDAEKIARYNVWDAFTANSGTYQVSGGTLTTHPTVAKNPSVMGSTRTREFKIEGNTMTLISKVTGAQASVVTAKLTRIE